VEEDILALRELLMPKKLLLVTHMNVKHNNEVFKQRSDLINLVENIALKHNIPCFNPTIALDLHKQCDIIKNDYGHYTPFGLNVVKSLMYDKLKNI